MMVAERRQTLLAKLAPMCGAQTENLAVEALGHILSGSEAARHALSEVLRSGGAKVGPIAQARTQVTDEESARPDLVGFDQDGKERVLIEAKFWAGLTENQPGGYLRRLKKPSAQQPSALLFVAPATRTDALWDELCRQVPKPASKMTLDSHNKVEGLRSAPVGSGRHLMLTSWRNLLGRMAAEAAAAADSHTETDIRQLQGLAEQEDAEAFLPLKQEELGPQLPRRVLDLIRLVDDVIDCAAETEWASTERRPRTAKAATYGVWMRFSRAEKIFKHADGLFGIDYEEWARCRDTPLWLKFGQTYAAPEVLRALECLRRKNPPELFGEAGRDVKIPIELPVGKEYNAVRTAVVERLEEIARLIVRQTSSRTAARHAPKRRPAGS